MVIKNMLRSSIGRTIKNPLLIIAILFGFAAASWGTVQAMTTFYKVITGQGNVSFDDQVTVTDINIVNSTKIKVKLTAKATTVPLYNYPVYLIINNSNDTSVVTSQTVSWTAAQVASLATKTITYTGLDLSLLTDYAVEVRQ